MTLSASIMSHPERRAELADLLDALDRPVPVYLDPHGPPSGKGDRVWSVAREAWLMFDPAATWHALIQDDAVPCYDLLAGLERAVEHVPAPAIVSPYLGKGRNVPARWERVAIDADRRGACWVRSDRVMWGVTLLAPTALIPEMVAWCDQKSGMPDDMRVAAFTRRHALDVYYTWPSLVDHLPETTTPSLTKHRARERVARRHHVGSALDLKWDGPVIVDPMALRRRPLRSRPRGANAARVTP